MYYRLKEPWSFRGWKGTPYAFRAEFGKHKHDRPMFIAKEPFLDLLYCNGEEDVDIESLNPIAQKIIGEMMENDYMEESAEPMKPLQPWQRYHVFPSRYVDSVHWSITGKCNFKCRHCLVSAPSAHHPQLPLEDLMHLVREMATCGINRVDITGGEPLVRNDFEQIVEALTKHGIDIGVIFTNASLLTANTLDILDRWHQHPSFQLSFDGLGHHDWLRGVPGAEVQADAAFKLLQERGFPVGVAMCIHKGNAESLRDTANYLAGYGAVSLKLNAPQKLGLWKQYSDEYALEEDEVWAVYRDYIGHYFADGMPLDIELDGYFFCKKGETNYRIPYVHHLKRDYPWDRVPYCESMRHNMYIGPDGRLAPCMGFSDTAIGKKFPSALEEPLGKLTREGYYRDVVDTTVGDLIAKNPECAECEHLEACCGGCMVEDITDDGDYLVPDGRCCYFHKHIGEQAVRDAADAAIRAAGLATEE
ncbi:MAG: radical SAM protein [Atopobiaceae bacterium]|nr:radical SAM protein [Atopobiaceae bacterium]